MYELKSLLTTGRWFLKRQHNAHLFYKWHSSYQHFWTDIKCTYNKLQEEEFTWITNSMLGKSFSFYKKKKKKKHVISTSSQANNLLYEKAYSLKTPNAKCINSYLPGLRHKKRWYVKLDLSLFMKHWMVPSRDPGCIEWKVDLVLLSKGKNVNQGCKLPAWVKREK